MRIPQTSHCCDIRVYLVCGSSQIIKYYQEGLIFLQSILSCGPCVCSVLSRLSVLYYSSFGGPLNMLGYLVHIPSILAPKSSDLQAFLSPLPAPYPPTWSFSDPSFQSAMVVVFFFLCTFLIASSWHLILLACLYLLVNIYVVSPSAQEASLCPFYTFVQQLLSMFLSLPLILLSVGYILVYTTFYYLVHTCFLNDFLVCSVNCQRLCLSMEDLLFLLYSVSDGITNVPLHTRIYDMSETVYLKRNC